MTIQLVEVLHKNPACCYFCNGVPVDLEGNVLPMVDTEAEANWGDNIYVCSECATVIAALFGYQTETEHIEQLEKAQNKVTELKRELKKTEKALLKEEGRNKVIDKAKKAMREKATK